MAREKYYKIAALVALGAIVIGGLAYAVYKYYENRDNSQQNNSREEKEVKKILENRTGRL